MNQVVRTMMVVAGLAMAGNAYSGDPSAVGDVTGRELLIRGLGWLGHIGMYDGSKVLEVLNEDSVIQKNTLKNFKDRSTYWGARYGDWSGLYKVIDKGWNQSKYSPTYTSTSLWREGGYTKSCVARSRTGRCTKYQQTLVRAKFRCDTFVLYSYYYGANVYLTTITTPRIVFNTLPKVRS